MVFGLWNRLRAQAVVAQILVRAAHLGSQQIVQDVVVNISTELIRIAVEDRDQSSQPYVEFTDARAVDGADILVGGAAQLPAVHELGAHQRVSNLLDIVGGPTLRRRLYLQ